MASLRSNDIGAIIGVPRQHVNPVLVHKPDHSTPPIWLSCAPELLPIRPCGGVRWTKALHNLLNLGIEYSHRWSHHHAEQSVSKCLTGTERLSQTQTSQQIFLSCFQLVQGCVQHRSGVVLYLSYPSRRISGHGMTRTAMSAAALCC
jgi:hypothetical protein